MLVYIQYLKEKNIIEKIIKLQKKERKKETQIQ